MPGSPAPVGSSGPLNPWWNSILGALRTGAQNDAALAAGAQQTNEIDQWGNTQVIVGQLNQVVTIGAAFQQSGVQVGTALPPPGASSVGVATQQGLATTTIATTKGSTSATVASAAGLAKGMSIGAANVSDPSSGVATAAITPGTTISGISGTTVTLSQAAAETGSGLYCAACFWSSVQGGTVSPFLQLLSLQKLRLAIGTGTCPLTNGSSVGTTQTIAHGLGGVPVLVGAFPRSTGSVGANPYTMAFGEANTPDATNIYINCDNVDGFTAWAAGNQAGFYWFAIG